MAAKYLRNIIVLAVMLLTTGCIYPFTPDIPEGEGRLVVEGNLYIGEVTKVTLSYVSPLTGLQAEAPKGNVWVEGSDGKRYDPIVKEVEDEEEEEETNSVFKIDLTKAPDDVQYRLHIINESNNHEYASEWKSVAKPAVIDSLSYIPNLPKFRMDIALSMHSEGSSYFRWSYEETWEYHSRFYSYYYYEPPVSTSGWGRNDPGQIIMRDFDKNIYTCWNTKPSSEIMLFSTESQVDDRFIDLEFHTIPRDDKRLQVLYYIEVSLEALDEEGYIYWNNIQKNSEYQGSIFSPNPSEMRGNITGITDPNEFVTGYINVARRAVKSLYIDNYDTEFFYDDYKDYEEPVASQSSQWKQLYQQHNIPVTYDYLSGVYYWAPQRCVDCRLFGGSKNKPDFWPRANI